MATFTDGEAKLLMCMLKHLKDGNLNTDFEAVAAELGYKDASVAKTRWGQIKKKKIEGSTTDSSPVKATPKKRKTKASDGADAEETPKAKKGRGKAKSADVVKEDSEEGASAIETTEKDEDVDAVGEKCGGMTVNAVVKKIKRMKEIEARQTTSTDGDISGSIDNKAVGYEKNKKASPQKAGRVEKRKSVKSAKAGDLLAKIKDEDSDQ
ncbi:hypothetical protein D0864_00188 [Hortaea werneckii]|uniref:Myb-like DNA-binding domain-containing protein n=1 Tax=Hortaea werneckii TaxID=91943 RepID=A0A3M7HM10_HORWE|nr:hypothetical protein D0864_00188 [Hortaea werneckii]